MIIVKSISSVIHSFGGLLLLPSSYTLLCEGSWFYGLNEAILISWIVSGSWSQLTRYTVNWEWIWRSYCRFLRWTRRIPLPRMVPPLFPFLHHVSTTLPSSLLSRSLLRCKLFIQRFFISPSISHWIDAREKQILLSAGIFDLATTRLKPKVRLQLVGVIALITIYTYWNFSPLTYAGSWTKSQCKSAKWVKNWDFSWYVFPYSDFTFNSF